MSKNSLQILRKDPKLSEIVERLVRTFHPEEIYLFGSRAKGGQHSDYDLLVVLPILKKSAREYSQQSYELLWGMGVSKDVIFTSTERFEGLKRVVNSVEEAAYTKGKVLYAA